MIVQIDVPLLTKYLAQTNSHMDHSVLAYLYGTVALIILIAACVTLFLWADNIQSVCMAGAILGILIVLIYIFYPSTPDEHLYQENDPVQQEDLQQQDRPSINHLEPDAQM